MLIALIYIVAFTALLAGAAAAIEWGSQGRIPTRQLWSAAIGLALMIPTATIAYTSIHPRVSPREARAGLQSSAVARAIASVDGAVANEMRDAARGDWVARAAVSTTLTITLAAAWAFCSIVLAAWAIFAVTRWRILRRSWHPEQMDGVEVHVSPATGPAVLGIITQRIVMPAWATSMPVEQRQLMLAHELEHVRARDPQRLAVALCALILMPWNAALWWCAARLRRAIEMDCDARVLRQYPRTREYGYLLLEVASRGRNAGALAVPLVGLLRLPSELELRLRAMTRPRSIAFRTLAGGSAGAIVAIATAFVTPVPRVGLPFALPQARSNAPATIATKASGTHAASVQPAPTKSWTELDPMRSGSESTTRQLRNSDYRFITVRQPLDDRGEAARVSRKESPDANSVHTPDHAVIEGRSEMRDVVELATAGNAFGPSAGIEAEVAQTNRDMDAMMSRYYPDMAGTSPVAAAGSVWFLVSRTGSVIATERVDDDRAPVSPESVAAHYPKVDPATIRVMSISQKSVRGSRMSVVWVQLNT